MAKVIKKYVLLWTAMMIFGVFGITAGASEEDATGSVIIEIAGLENNTMTMTYGDHMDEPEAEVFRTIGTELEKMEVGTYIIFFSSGDESIVVTSPSGFDATGTGSTEVTASVIENGTYEDLAEITFTVNVETCSVADAEVEFMNQEIVYNGTPLSPALSAVIVNGGTLEKGTDYSVIYKNNLNAGTGKLTVIGTGNYNGTCEETFTIHPAEITSCEVDLSLKFYYSGDDKVSYEPIPIVKAGELTVPQSCYDIEYVDNAKVGTAKVQVTAKKDPATGIQNFTGSAEGTFEILPMDMSHCGHREIANQTYTGETLRPAVTVRNPQNIILKENTDYVVSYDNNVNAGTAVFTVTGTGNYVGTKTGSFQILPAPVTHCELTSSFESVYTGSEYRPEVNVYSGERLLNTDGYEIEYINNINAGKAGIVVTGIGNYRGTANTTFEILPNTINEKNTWVDYSESHAYTGLAVTPSVEAGNGYGNLVLDRDYMVTYENNIQPGTAVIIVTGIGNYQGTVRKTFTIMAPPASEGGSTTVPEGGSTDGSTIVPEGGSTTAPDDSLESEDPAQKVLPIGKSIKKTSLNGHFKVTGHAEGGVCEVQYVKPVSKSKKKIVIPAAFTVDGITCKVTSIAKNAFKGNKKITSVTIGKNVTTIGSSAFSGCTKLSKVTIGSNVKTIGSKAFYKCTALKKITIPSKVTKINKQAFYGCKNLKSITIKTAKLSKKKVGSKAFTGINKKATIKVPKSRLKTYRSMLRARGVSKSAVIKK